MPPHDPSAHRQFPSVTSSQVAVQGRAAPIDPDVAAIVTDVPQGTLPATAVSRIEGTGLLITAGTAGTFKVQWVQRVSDVTAQRMLQGLLAARSTGGVVVGNYGDGLFGGSAIVVQVQTVFAPRVLVTLTGQMRAETRRNVKCACP
jgi:hypothetical protein